MNVPCVLKKFLILLRLSGADIYLIVWFGSLSLLIFILVVLSVADGGSPNSNCGLFGFFFLLALSVLSLCVFMLLFGAYKFRIVLCSWWIDPPS